LLSFTPPFQPNQQTIEVNINPSTFPIDHNSSLTSIRKNWFLNLSSISIPFEVQCLLQLGQNFSLPTLNIKYNVLELIKNIENNIKKLNIDIQSNIRNHTIPIILKLFAIPPQNNNNQKNINNKLLALVKSAKSFIKNHPYLLFTRADKGNCTVALDNNLYMNKMDNFTTRRRHIYEHQKESYK